MQLFINREFLGSIIEGCNSLSIIILFAAFIVAFREKWWNGKFDKLRHSIKSLLLITLTLDLLYQIENALEHHWQFSPVEIGQDKRQY